MPKKAPYIAIELDAIEDAEAAARSINISPDVILAGLPRLWRHCWRKKTDRVKPYELGVFFTGAGERQEAFRGALIATGFLERGSAESGDRVKGAARLLRISASKAKGGHAAKGNLRRGTEPGPGICREESEDPPADPPAAPRLLQPTASSQQPTDLPPNPPRNEGGGSGKAPRRRRDRSAPGTYATGRVLNIGECAGCGRGASAAMGDGSQKVKLCYQECLSAAEAWADQVSPEKPWLAPFADWAAARRGTGPPVGPSSAGGAA